MKVPNYEYNILIGCNNILVLGKELRRLAIGKSIFLITSPRIGKLYQKLVLKSLRGAGFDDIAVYHLPDGEKNKSIVQHSKVLDKLANFDDGQSKKIFIINLGGGVVGDLGGFVAGVYHRGIPYVQIPTTLLACVDSGVGGKVGVNLFRYKNSVGMFWQPRLVFVDIVLLKTLSKRQFKSGLAEVIKYGISLDAELFDYIECRWEELRLDNSAAILRISEKCYKIKVGIVVRDVRDTKDIRIMLNYGHTIGHAIESASRYAFTHGESVAIGIVCANDIAVRLGVLRGEVSDRIETLLMSMKLPTRIKNCGITDILDSMVNDKKFIHGKNKFILLRDIGKCIIREGIDHKLIRDVIEHRMEGAR